MMKNKEVGIFDSMFTENSTRTTLIASIKHSSGNLFIFQIMWFIVIIGCAMLFSNLDNDLSYYGQAVLLIPILLPSYSYMNTIYPSVKDYVRQSKKSILILINVYAFLFWLSVALIIVSLAISHYGFSIFNINFVAVTDIIVFTIGIFDKIFIKLISDARVRNAVIIKKGPNNA